MKQEDGLEYIRSLAGYEEKKAAVHNPGGSTAPAFGQSSQDVYKRQAKYTGKKVSAGPTEATAIGNVTVQMMHDGVFASLPEARICIDRSFDIKKYDENGKKF